MPFFDFFRNFIGSNNKKEPTPDGFDSFGDFKDSFRNPIWQNDDDEDDEDDFRRAGPGTHFGIFNDPIEITRYFETEMDNILKNFFHGFEHGMPWFRGDFQGALPSIGQKKSESPRDQVLKPYHDSPRYDSESAKVDEVLDGKISGSNFAKAWEDLNTSKEDAFPKRPVPYNGIPNYNRSVGRSIRTETVRKADGSVEHKEVIRNSDGSEETRISKQMGDKKYTVTTKRDKDGVETKTEDLMNMDKSELENFDQKWTPIAQPDLNQRSTFLKHIPWENFFGPNPKL